MIKNLLKIAQNASAAILNISDVEIFEKQDGSPFTNADLASEAIILEALRELTPETPIISEEQPLQDFSERQTWEQYWLVDPLDGTRNYIKGTQEISINIALIENQEPVLGLIYSPYHQLAYFAQRGNGAFMQTRDEDPVQIHTRKLPDLPIVLARESQLKGFERKIGHDLHATRDFIGSALKFGRIAQGLADLYPCLGRTGEWDTAAGQLLLDEAGGKVVALNGEILRYNTKKSIQNPPFIAVGDERLLTELKIGV